MWPSGPLPVVGWARGTERDFLMREVRRCTAATLPVPYVMVDMDYRRWGNSPANSRGFIMDNKFTLCESRSKTGREHMPPTLLLECRQHKLDGAT